MKHPILDVKYLINLPAPPLVVADAIDAWIQYLRFLPRPGPKLPGMCAGIEKEYRHITKKLQAQYHPNEPDESQMYDWRKGEAMERHIHALAPRRKDIVIGVHFKNTKIPTMLHELKINEEKFHRELRSAYLTLAGKLCPSK